MNAPIEEMATSQGQGEDEDETWYVVPCPKGIRLTAIGKERSTHGCIYAIWDTDGKSAVWLSQSIPSLVKIINEKAIASNDKRLHASSLYRCLRRESRKNVHKSKKVEKFGRNDLGALNAFISQFPGIIVASKCPELWHCDTQSIPSELAEPASDSVEFPSLKHVHSGEQLSPSGAGFALFSSQASSSHESDSSSEA